MGPEHSMFRTQHVMPSRAGVIQGFLHPKVVEHQTGTSANLPVLERGRWDGVRLFAGRDGRWAGFWLVRREVIWSRRFVDSIAGKLPGLD